MSYLIKLCIDCKYYLEDDDDDWLEALCNSPFHNYISFVNGEERMQLVTCTACRNNQGACNPDATLFEPKDEK